MKKCIIIIPDGYFDLVICNDGILNRTHLRFFTEKSLKRTVFDNGFVVDQFIGINSYKKKGFGVKRVSYGLAIFILGADLRFMQFGICIRRKGNCF